MTLWKLLEWGKKELAQDNVPEAELSAWYLLQYICKLRGQLLSRSDFFLHKEDVVESDLKDDYATAINRRKQRIPLEYITGETEFMGIPFMVNESVLIPRQDTETVVEHILPTCTNKRVLDMCTGSGCIGLSIAVLAKPKSVVLCDISKEALEVAESNMRQLGDLPDYEICPDVSICQGDLFKNINDHFDVIVSNPPYIETMQTKVLMPEVRDNEPMMALDGGEDGLTFYRRIIEESPLYLSKQGVLCFEIGYDQGISVSELMKKQGFTDVDVLKDLAGNDRIVSGVWTK